MEDFDALVRARYERLRRAAFVLTGDRDAADDLVQSALVKVMRHWSRVRAADDVDAYLFKTLTFTYRTALRRRWTSERPHAHVDDLADSAGADDGLVAVPDRTAVVAALSELSPAHREVLVLRYMADWSEAETATVLGCSVGTVKSRASRALAVLRAAGTLDRPVVTENQR